MSNKDFMPCRLCAGSPTPGYIEDETEIEGRPGYKYKVLRKCACREKYDREKVYTLRLKKSNLRTSMLDYEPTTHYKGNLSTESMLKLVKYGQGLTEDIYANQSLYLYGPYGTQKTTLAQWVGKKAIDHGLTPYYTLMRSLVNALVDSQYNDPDTTDEIKKERRNLINNASKCDVLLLDESFDLAKMTMYKSNYQLPFLDEFIRDRMDIKEKPIVFVSNVAIRNMDKAFGAIQDLLSRKISSVGGELHFRDNYMDASNDFNITDIFA